jgi:hypothetical protein
MKQYAGPLIILNLLNSIDLLKFVERFEYETYRIASILKRMEESIKGEKDGN